MAVDDFLKYLEHEKRYSPHTLKSCKTDLHQFSKFLISNFEESSIRRTKSIQIRSWIAQLADNGISNRTIQRKISSLRAYFKFLVRHKEIESSPAEEIITPKSSPGLPQFVEEKNLIKLVFNPAMYTEDFSGTRDRLLLKILYYTGMRLSELINLKANDLDEFNLTIKVLGKRNKERIIPITKGLLIDIKEYIKIKYDCFDGIDGTYLLVTDKGKKLYPKFVYRKVNHYLSLVTTLSKKSPHILRHSFATHMLNRGADLNAIKEILGHADLTATQVYTHNSIAKLKNVHKLAHPKG